MTHEQLQTLIEAYWTTVTSAVRQLQVTTESHIRTPNKNIKMVADLRGMNWFLRQMKDLTPPDSHSLKGLFSGLIYQGIFINKEFNKIPKPKREVQIVTTFKGEN